MKRKKFTPLSFKPEKIIWRWNESNGAIFMNLENKNGYLLDEVSVKVWQMLREGLNTEVILKKIV